MQALWAKHQEKRKSRGKSCEMEQGERKATSKEQASAAGAASASGRPAARPGGARTGGRGWLCGAGAASGAAAHRMRPRGNQLGNRLPPPHRQLRARTREAQGTREAREARRQRRWRGSGSRGGEALPPPGPEPQVTKGPRTLPLATWVPPANWSRARPPARGGPGPSPTPCPYAALETHDLDQSDPPPGLRMRRLQALGSAGEDRGGMRQRRVTSRRGAQG